MNDLQDISKLLVAESVGFLAKIKDSKARAEAEEVLSELGEVGQRFLGTGDVEEAKRDSGFLFSSLASLASITVDEATLHFRKTLAMIAGKMLDLAFKAI